MNNTEQEMIQEHELRLGNLVLYCDEIQEITAIRRYEYNLSNTDGNVATVDVEPIPLTPEILDKCGFSIGFECKGYNYWYPNEEGLWSIRQEGSGMWQFCIFVRSTEIWKFDDNIASLHQLQNLYFALTQTELEIKW